MAQEQATLTTRDQSDVDKVTAEISQRRGVRHRDIDEAFEELDIMTDTTKQLSMTSEEVSAALFEDKLLFERNQRR